MTEAADRIEAELRTAFELHAHELLVLCYRMVGSLSDAEDLRQETFLKAWRRRHSFRRDSSPRTWLYRIATNACLDFVALHERRTAPSESLADLIERDPRIGPFPDRYPTSGPAGPDPAVVVEGKETTELLLLAALRHLPPRQRSAVIARDFLDLSAAETADLLGTSVASANSLVQRARAELRRRHQGGQLSARTVDEDEDLVRRYVAAHHDGDAAALTALLADDVRVSMPPAEPHVGRDAVAAFFASAVGSERPGQWRLVPTRANGRPATANYLKRPGDSAFRAFSIDVLDSRQGQLIAVNCFLGSRNFTAFGLPDTT